MQTAQKLTPEELAATANHSTPASTDKGPILPSDLEEAPVVKPVPVADEKPNILIVGQSGSGKSRSLKNLNPDRTIILSTEMKKLPFRGANKFTKNTKVSNFSQFKRVFERALTSDKADVIIVDSFTSLTEFAYNEIVKPCDPKKTMQAWQTYKDELHSILVQSKTSAKYIVFIAVEGETLDSNGQRQVFANVQGQLKNNVEKEFTVVFWSTVIGSPVPNEQSSQYAFMTNKDDANKAKSPEEMFPQLIPNDLSEALNWMDKYYDDDNEYEYTGPTLTLEQNLTGDLPE